MVCRFPIFAIASVVGDGRPDGHIPRLMNQLIISLSKAPMPINAYARACMLHHVHTEHFRDSFHTAPCETLKGTQLYSFGARQHLSRCTGEQGKLARDIAHVQTLVLLFHRRTPPTSSHRSEFVGTCTLQSYNGPIVYIVS